MVKVPLRHVRDVPAAEDADLKVVDLARLVGRLEARRLEAVRPLEVQEDDVVGADVLGDLLPRPAVREEVGGVCEVDAVLGVWSVVVLDGWLRGLTMWGCTHSGEHETKMTFSAPASLAI